MSKKMIDLIVGARPNFVKCTILHKVLRERGYNVRLIHTGQHYNRNMSDIFFNDLHIPKEDINLNAGSSSHAVQTANIMMKYEEILIKKAPEMVIVFGDVNSTIAAILTAAKLHIRTAHVEAGLRSSDMTMPEEINRLATDSIADLLLAPSRDAVKNLRSEGHKTGVFMVGNIMIDTLKAHMNAIEKIDIKNRFNLNRKDYVYLTLHRPSNVDSKEQLVKVLDFLSIISAKFPIFFPIHPRTEQSIKKFGLSRKAGKIFTKSEPVSYLESIKLAKDSAFVITDSGGIQEETTYLRVPCYTLRPNTERPITVTHGTNTLIKPEKSIAKAILAGKLAKKGRKISSWDGHTSERICDILNNII